MLVTKGSISINQSAPSDLDLTQLEENKSSNEGKGSAQENSKPSHLDEKKLSQQITSQRKSDLVMSSSLLRKDLSRSLEVKQNHVPAHIQAPVLATTTRNSQTPPAPTLEQLRGMANRVGVPENTFNEVAARLQQLPPSEFQRESRMIQECLRSKNARAAFQVYRDLNWLRNGQPERFTPEVVRMLVMGTGRQRADTPQGHEGILTRDSAFEAANALSIMPQSEFNRIRGLLDRAGTGSTNANASTITEQALILKATAARSNQFGSEYSNRARLESGQPLLATMQIESFANEIRGIDRDSLIRYTSGINTGLAGTDQPLSAEMKSAHHPFIPREPNVLAAFGNFSFAEKVDGSALSVFRAEQDPAYAWALNRAKYDGVNSEVFKNENEWIEGSMTNALRQNTKRTYNEHNVENSRQARSAAIDSIVNDLNYGRDVMIRVWGSGGYQVVTDIRGNGSQREFLVTDTQKGITTTTWISESEIRNNLQTYYSLL